MLSIAAYWLAVGAGVPAWTQWEPGDAADIAIFVFVVIGLLTTRRAAQ